MLTAANPWATVESDPPFIADVDRSVLDGLRQARFAVRLDGLPHVWHGNPSTARALLLMLNHGFSEQDLVDQATPVFMDAVRGALALEPTGRCWPLLPDLENSSAARWWRPRLAPLATALGPTGDAILRDHLCDIEYFPYHPVNWRSPPRLPSQEFGFGLVRQAMNSRSRNRGDVRLGSMESCHP